MTPRLDETDEEILRALQRDGRASYADLGPAVGLSTMAMLGVRADGDLRAVADAVAACEGVIYVVLTAGSFDLFVEVVCHTPAELLDVVNEGIKAVPGVTSVETFTYFGIHTHRFVWDVPWKRAGVRVPRHRRANTVALGFPGECRVGAAAGTA